jgi:branched-chain amino acid transport system substrate-binding protein
MQKANSIDPKVYRPALQKVSFDGITGPIAFDDKGALKNASSTLYQVKNGAWVPVVTKSGM